MNNKFEEKIWGSVFHTWDDLVATSVLRVTKGFRCSNHYHRNRWNSFKVITGSLDIVFLHENGDQLLEFTRRRLKSKDSIDVLPGVIHRFEVVESGIVVETYWTQNKTPVDIGDIVRYDEGGRV